MKKSIFLFFAAILCAMTANAATVTSDGTARLYFKMSAVDWWIAGNNGDGNFAYFYNNSTGKNAWSAHAVKYSGNDYYITIPEGSWAGVILTRNSVNSNPSWSNKWNQTGDITLSETSNYISKFSEGSTSVTWGTQKPASKVSVTATPANALVGEEVSLSSALTSNTSINTYNSATYSANGGTVNGNKFTASEAGTYTITTTVTYYPNCYSKITSTATATTTVVVTSAEEPKHDVTVSWKCGETELQASQTLSVGESTANTAEAPEFKDYTFSGWDLGSGVQSADANANPISITTKASGDYTLTAKYTYIEPVIKTIYCKMEYDWWTQASAAISAYISGTYGESTGVGSLMTLAPLEGNVWKIDVDVARYQKIRFIRVNPEGTSDWGARTGLVEIPTDDKNLYTITQSSAKWSGDCPGTWSVYEAPATAPKRYITGNKELVGGEGWKANEIEMTYNNGTSTYSHTFLASALTAGTEYKLKVTEGNWDGGKWGTINGTIPGVSNDGDGNVCFKLSTVGDVTVTFDGAKITVSTTGTFYVPKTYEYYIAGDEAMTGFDWNNAGLGIEDTDADGVYSHVFTNLAAGTYNFRITDGTWTNTWGWSHLENNDFVELSAGDNDNNIKLTLTAAKTVTVNYNKTTKKVSIDGLTPVTYSDITIKAYTESAAPQIWWWNGGSKCPDASKTDNPSSPSNKYTWETAPAMTAVTGEANWYEWTFTQVNDLTGISFQFKNATTASGNFEGIKADACYDARDIANAKTTECGVTPTTCLECSGIYLKGEFNTWLPDNEFMKTGDANVVTLSITLEKGNYDFKVHGDEWYGNTGDMTRENTNQAWTFSKDVDDKANIRVDVSGEYIFSWKISEKQLTVTYPEFPSLSTQPEKLYFRPTTDWKSANAKFAAFFLDGDKGTNAKWEDFTDADGDGVYEVDNDKKYLTIIICRMNPEGTDPDNWKNKWNQSADLTIPTTQYLNSWIDNENKWDGATGIWTVLIGEGDNSTTLLAANGQTASTLVNRQFTTGNLYTISLPFTLENVDDVFGNVAYEYTSLAKNGENVVLYFSKVNTIEAGKPYLIEPTKAVPGFIVEDVTLTSTLQPITFSEGGTGVTMEPVVSVGASATTAGKYWLAADRYLYNDENTLKSLRALFTISSAGGIAPRVRVALDENGETALDNITTGETTVKAIINGQLIIIRDGEMYNAQGQKL